MNSREYGTVSATPVILSMPMGDGKEWSTITVTVIPGAGNTSLCEFSTSSQADIETGAATWQAWPSGTVAVTTNDYTRSKVSGLRFTRVTGVSDDHYEVIS